MSVALVKNYGLELPVYDYTTEIAWTKQDIINAAAKNIGGYFVRRTVLDAAIPVDGNLKDTLGMADRAIDDVCSHIRDTSIVDYQWGLYAGTCPPGAKPMANSSKLPDSIIKGYSLVARVQALDNIRPRRSTRHKLESDIRDYVTASHDNLDFVLGDLRSEQFVGSREDKHHATLVDIEPRMFKPYIPTWRRRGKETLLDEEVAP